MRNVLFFFILSLMFTACGGGELSIPKPRSYPRVYYPERAYAPVEPPYCAFSFEQPVSATINKEESFFDETPPNECWFDLRFDPALNGSVHFSYYPIHSADEFEQLLGEAFKLVGVHNDRASDIKEIVIHREEANVHGIAFDIAGPAASPFQFFLTDSTAHFLRGALYFDAVVQPDSLAPIIAYAKEDIYRMVESFKWE